jgi:transposase
VTRGVPAVLEANGEVVVPKKRSTVTLEMARGAGPLVLRISHFHPYEPDKVRAVRLIPDADELFIDITAWVQVEPATVVSGRAAGADPGIIHTWAVSYADQALLVSGRGVRAEERLHLEDTEARNRKNSAKARPVRARPGRRHQKGSRRWRRIQARQKKADVRNRRRRAHASHTAANHVKAFMVANEVETLRYGDPAGITDKDCGAVHNRRVHRWPRPRQRDAVLRRLEEVGITAEPVDERGSSSHCPSCGARAVKAGRSLTCTSASCGTRHHRDLAGSQNIARQGEDSPRTEITSVEHRRVGKPARRDRRRQLWVERRRAEAEGNARIRAAEVGEVPAEESSVADAA